MTRPIEDRVTAALEARAELVGPEDLGTFGVPDRGRRPRSGVVLLLVAAAAAVVIALPFVLGGGDGSSPDPAPEPTEAPSVSESVPTESVSTSEQPTDEATEQHDVVRVDRQTADVDADGRPDDVQLFVQGTDPDEPGDGSLEVTLGTGGGGAGTSVPFGYPGDLLPALDLNGDGREQVLLPHTQGGDSGQLLVYTWHQGGITQAQHSGNAPLGIELDGGGLVGHYYVDDGVLFSWRRTDPVNDGPTYNVEQWSWTVDGDRLVATPEPNACVDVTGEDPPQPC